MSKVVFNFYSKSNFLFWGSLIQCYAGQFDTHQSAPLLFSTVKYTFLFFVAAKMVRHYVPKTDRGNINEENMNRAITEVLEKTLSIRKAAEKHNVMASTLQHRVEKMRKTTEQNTKESYLFSSKYTVSQVFTTEQEKMLTDYMINCSKMHYGLSLNQTRALAYQYAKHLGCKYPKSWDDNQCAGMDWLAGFRKRNEALSLRKPENTSAARSFGFNKSAVTQFFDNYERVMSKYQFAPDRIINLDETGITTVLPTPKVLADKRQKQVGQLVSGERGELVTFCGIVTASGNALPPVYVFPRVHFKEHFLNGAPEGSLGLANKSGWMNAELHLQVLKHIQRHTLSSKENPVLLLCDNHESHISIDAVNFCREHGIIYLSFPPHTSHKMQPLDVGVFGPFKGKLKVAFNDWHVMNVTKTITIYQIAELSKTAFLDSFTPKNITSGFSKPGIWPFNKLAFADEDFAPTEMFSLSPGEKEAINLQSSQESCQTNLEGNNCKSVDAEKTSENCEAPEVIPSTSKAIISPEVVRPYPTAITREKKSRKIKREKGKSRILTDTPEKDRLQMLHDEKEKKRQEKEKKQEEKKLKVTKNIFQSKKDTKKRKKRRRDLSDSDTDSDLSAGLMSCDDEDISSEQEESNDDTFSAPNPENIEIGDFILVKFEKKKSVLHYVASVVSKFGLTEYNVSYLRKKPSSWIFVYPPVEDLASVDFTDVVLKLPSPYRSRGTSRTSSLFKFSVDLSIYNVQ